VLGIKDHLKAKELAWNLFGKKEEPKEDIINTLPKNMPQQVGIYIITTDDYIYLDKNKGNYERYSRNEKDISLKDEFFFTIDKVVFGYRVPIEKFRGFLIISEEYPGPTTISIRIISPICQEKKIKTLPPLYSIGLGSFETIDRFECKIKSIICRGKFVKIKPNVFVKLCSEEEKNQILTKNNCFQNSEHCFLIVEMEIKKHDTRSTLYPMPGIYRYENYHWLIELTK
jgi:hypothetical protein